MGLGKTVQTLALVAQARLEQAGAVLDVRRPYADGPAALPGDLDDHDALLVLGGSMGAHDDADHGWLAPGALVVVERSARGSPPSWPAGLQADRSRTYGETVLWYGRATA